MLGIYVHIETFVGIFIAVLFINPKWKQPKCSSNKINVYTYNGVVFDILKKC